MIQEFIFDRKEERQRIGRFLEKRSPFLVYGPSGVGKSLLVRSVLCDLGPVLYCEDSSTAASVFRNLARSLLRRESPRARRSIRDADSITAKSAVSLKGIVMDALRESEFSILLDHLKRPSSSFAAAVREIMSWCSTPVSAVARSSHMEDVGSLQPLYDDRSQRCEVRNFDDATAGQFARELITKSRLSGSNIGDFLDKVIQFSAGNPQAIMAMIEMAAHPKYRSHEHIKISPLYIDFRMNGGAAR
jgi:AAA+ ATPase superfamily predicted ATPase